MTAFEDLERGDIIWASDPLSEKGRPMLVLGAPQLPNHGTQLITVLLSTKTYHEESLTLQDDDYEVTHQLTAEGLNISPLTAEMILQALRPVVHEHYGIGEDVRHDTEEGANV